MAPHWTHLGNYMSPIWATYMGSIRFLSTCGMWLPHMGPGFCSHFPQILSTFLPRRARYGFGLSVAKVSRVGWGSQILVCLSCNKLQCGNKLWLIRQKMSFSVTMKINYWFKMFLENENISFIKTVIYPLYDINKYVLCKGLNIHLYLSYKID